MHCEDLLSIWAFSIYSKCSLLISLNNDLEFLWTTSPLRSHRGPALIGYLNWKALTGEEKKLLHPNDTSKKSTPQTRLKKKNNQKSRQLSRYGTNTLSSRATHSHGLCVMGTKSINCRQLNLSVIPSPVLHTKMRGQQRQVQQCSRYGITCRETSRSPYTVWQGSEGCSILQAWPQLIR